MENGDKIAFLKAATKAVNHPSVSNLFLKKKQKTFN